MNDSVITILAVFTFMAQAFVLVIALLALIGRLGVPQARNWLTDIRLVVGPNSLWFAFIVATVATAGSLYFSEGKHFVPCNMCWYQRICMYPLVPLLFQAAIRNDRRIRPYVLVQAGIGGLLSTYHIMIERGIVEESKSSCGQFTSCAANPLGGYSIGYLTIPIMALSAFALIFVLALLIRERHIVDEGTLA